METMKNAVKGATSEDSQFAQGHKVPISHQDPPGHQGDMPGKQPVNEHIPTEDGGYQRYKAAGKLEGKKALITGGDSGIGRAIAILFAMEGAESLIAYLPHEEDDAQATKKRVEEYNGKCHLFPTDLTSPANCQKIIDGRPVDHGRREHPRQQRRLPDGAEGHHRLARRTVAQDLRHQHPPPSSTSPNSASRI